MKTPRQTPNQISGWQAERAKIYHRACLSLKSAIQRGEPVGRSILRVARRYNGRQFKAEPSRRLAMSPKSLRRFWDAWNRGGERPAAFALHYRPRYRFIPAPVLIRFAEFCANQPRRSVAAAWRAFAVADGRRAGKPLKMSDFLLRKYFPVAGFYLIQGELKAIATAQTRLAEYRLAAIAEINRRLPGRQAPPRTRKANQTDH